MYRQYENPRTLEQELADKRAEYEALRAQGLLDAMDEEDYALEIAELEERVNFAWQDEEYDEMHRDIDLANEAAFAEVYE